ncbi:MAG TPA: YeeE/YedE family protein [Alcanivorax sp.]|nr:YeeE/YedE family protein [Alcanivorax sp.]
MTIVNFTPLTGLIGGLLIGASASLLLWLNGRIAGISGIVAGATVESGDDRTWRWLFLVGLLGGAALAFWLVPASRAFQADMPWPVFLVAGLIVGFGTRLGSGCTSGHGVCGLARLSPRSLASVVTFMVTGVLTVFVVRHVLGVGV